MDVEPTSPFQSNFGLNAFPTRLLVLVLTIWGGQHALLNTTTRLFGHSQTAWRSRRYSQFPSPTAGPGSPTKPCCGRTRWGDSPAVRSERLRASVDDGPACDAQARWPEKGPRSTHVPWEERCEPGHPFPWFSCEDLKHMNHYHMNQYESIQTWVCLKIGPLATSPLHATGTWMNLEQTRHLQPLHHESASNCRSSGHRTHSHRNHLRAVVFFDVARRFLQVCREGANANVCVACTAVAQVPSLADEG